MQPSRQSQSRVVRCPAEPLTSDLTTVDVTGRGVGRTVSAPIPRGIIPLLPGPLTLRK